MIFKDESNDMYIFDPIMNEIYTIPVVSGKCFLPKSHLHGNNGPLEKTIGSAWETASTSTRSIFITWDDCSITTHAFQPLTVKGPKCLILGTTKLPHGLKPVIFSQGSAICQVRKATKKAPHLKLFSNRPPQASFLRFHYPLMSH